MMKSGLKQVTRNIDPGSAQDLLERVPRACLSFACSDGPQAQPVAFQWRDGRYLVGIQTGERYQPGTGQEAVLLIDEGSYYFDLRAIYIRGQTRPIRTPPDARAGCAWFEVVPLKIVAWDYGMLREVIHDEQG